MRVTLDIPEGYEAKIVPSEKIDKVVFEFLSDYHDKLPSVVYEKVQQYFQQYGWTDFSLHTNPCTDGSIRYVVMAHPK